MGLATVVMGILPSYHTYGISMSIIFVACRIAQGLSLGGEIPGAVTFISEHTTQRASQACSIILFFILSGIFLANSIFSILDNPFLRTLPIQGWRIAFLLGGIFAVISYFLRKQINESPEYLKHKGEIVKIPLIQLLKTMPYQTILGICIVAPAATIVVMGYMYLTHYMQVIGGYTIVQISYYTLGGLFVFMLATVFWGGVADKVGAKKVYVLGGFLASIISYPYYSGILQHSHSIWIILLMAVFSGMMLGTFASILSNIFPVNVRYSGIALCYNIGTAIFSGLTPVISTYFIYKNSLFFIPAWIVIAACLAGITAVLALNEKNTTSAKIFN